MIALLFFFVSGITHCAEERVSKNLPVAAIVAYFPLVI